jgi:hypothetical protein
VAKPATPNNFYSQQGNGQVYLSWDMMTGATYYQVYKSTDGLDYASGGSPFTTTAPNYVDTAVTLGVQYFYKVSAANGDGESSATAAQNLVPSPSGEMSLGELRTQAQQRSDRLGSSFVTLTEWNNNINSSMQELYDLLVTCYEDYFIAPAAKITADGSTFMYPLPDGVTTFKDENNSTFVPSPFYKLRGVDLSLNSANNAYVTINKFNFIERNRFVYPNTASTIYGVFNLQYRLMGTKLEFIPTPAAGQSIRLWYIPRLPKLLKDNDLTTIGISGWLEYVITDAAIKALQKEESDITVLGQQKMMLIKRIEESAMNRDAGAPDRISDTRANGQWGAGSGGYGGNGPIGGY